MRCVLFFAALLCVFPLFGQTIAEKKAGTNTGPGDLTPEMQRLLVEVNRDIRTNRQEIQRLYQKVYGLAENNAPIESFRDLVEEIQDLQENIRMLEESWREMAARSGIQSDGYALWHQPETTVEQIVIDFGSSQYVYLIPPDIASIKLTVGSNIPIPNASWEGMLEGILTQSGIGIRQVNPFLRELFFLQKDLSDIQMITASRDDLLVLPPEARVCFVLAPEPSDVGRVFFFLDKFVNQASQVMQNLGRAIMVVASVSEIQEILKIYDFILASRKDLEYKIVPLLRVDAQEMAKIVNSIFEQFEQEKEEVEQKSTQAPTPSQRGAKGEQSARPAVAPKRSGPDRRQVVALTVIPLEKVAQAVFLVGTKEEIEKAGEIIRSVEAQVGEATDKTIYQYVVKHSDPEELAEVMSKVYQMMQLEGITQEKTPAEGQQQAQVVQAPVKQEVNVRESPQTFIPRTEVFREGFYQQGQFVVNPTTAAPGRSVEQRKVNVGRDNFIVELKSNSIVMVVEAFLLPKMKELLRKLDVPKKMVQIDVLLFERRLKRENDFGLNLLKIGSCASQTRKSCIAWNDILTNAAGSIIQDNTGITRLIMSRRKGELGNLPAFDIVYRFLMSQEDITLNASPSVVTVNQTEALIEVKEEISISTGTFEIPQTGTGAALKDAFVRAQYGITIRVTPTVHMHDEEDPLGDQIDYITLNTDVTFDTFSRTTAANIDRPPVNTRHVVNEVRVPDGQSVIMGGLRRRNLNDNSDKIPFLGEIPGIGKLFSSTQLLTDDVEMIIFLKPKIIENPVEDFCRIRRIELTKRPGDIPSYLCCLNQALDYEKYRAFEGSMTILFGRPTPRCYPIEHDCDGKGGYGIRR